MVDIAAAGRTVFLSSHQIGEVERVADIVAIMRAGKLLAVERLEDLKDQIRELTVTLADDAALPPLGGRILHERRHRQQLQLLVRGLGEAELAGLRADRSVRELGIRTPSLEEIFVAYLESSDSPDATPPARAEAVAR